MPTPDDPGLLPRYHGADWLPTALPGEAQDWIAGSRHGLRQRGAGTGRTRRELRRLAAEAPWQWPEREVIVITDLHADADGLLGSLVASGGAAKTGPADEDLQLTPRGAAARWIFAGDFVDKGPSNLRLLRVLRRFLDTGADAVLLAGNHDLRVRFGMGTAGRADDPRDGHFFVRMGAKGVPFLRELRDGWLTAPDALDDVPDLDTCRRQLIPGEAWRSGFPAAAAAVMRPPAVERELRKIRKKAARFEAACAEAGLDLREAWAAARVWRQLFLDPDGEFAWFHRDLRLAHREGSFLFVHAGLDDHTAAVVRDHGTGHLNRLFADALDGSPFDFYFGPIANAVRTKYRAVDGQLTRFGAATAQRAGIRAVVHGHRNLLRGQRLALRKGLVHLECDVTLDRTSRAKEGLTGIGAGATLIRPDGRILGISCDWGAVKLFDVAAAAALPLAS